MTPQELFNTVYAHLLKQNIQAKMHDNVGCYYRAPNGNMCAVGCLITDEEYDPDMEGMDVVGLRKEALLPDWMKPHAELLTDLQAIHDDSQPDQWGRLLAKVAREHNLEVPTQ